MYPRECYSINETATRNAKAEYDRKRKFWYDTAEKMYPNYWKMSFRERLAIREEINKSVGYSM